MSRFGPALLLVLATTTARLRGDSPPPLAADSAPAQPAAAPAASHTLSPATSAKLAAALPKFLARPAPTSPAGQAAAAPVDLREVDRPRNTIVRLPNFQEQQPSAVRPSDPSDADAPRDGVVRLPNYEVRDRKLPALKERDLLTPQAKIDLEFKRHPGLHIGNLFGLNRGIAAAMADEEDTYQRRLEMEDLVGFQKFIATLPPPQSDDTPAPVIPAPASTPAPAAPNGK